MIPVKDEREMLSGVSTEDGSTTLSTPTQKTHNSESPLGKSSRRGFLGQTTTMLAAAFAGIWVLANPKRAVADPFHCYDCTPPPHTPPPPIDYTTQSLQLVNNLIAAFNAHDTATVMSYFTSAGVSQPKMQTHLSNAFYAFPNLQLTVTSMSAGPLGRTVTVNHQTTGQYTNYVSDPAVNNSGARLGVNDVITGWNTLTISNGSYITSVVGSANIVPVFQAYNAQVIVGN
jgi:hypothetical protein